ncbi:cyclophilin-like fold protein [Chryseobacterium sp. SL1]|uniref:cyclophilin-like fold protein n=1 Tax=Chryseobacterium sp. SL1 TaxID=2995159 RepID=UPI0022727869|nr:cyclophilin-like fold protein [Chryseobacterium sp. SL1]MCY1663659.1 cyclophilin-like fold protein [Chryseobacterium sp. SL1]
MNLKTTINSKVFKVNLQDNATAKAFKELLPLTLDMKELNSNEKYAELPESLPVKASGPGTIQNGDLMLYGSNVVVLFYKTFSTSYAYTKIGNVDHADDLADALGSDNVLVKFESDSPYETVYNEK